MELQKAVLRPAGDWISQDSGSYLPGGDYFPAIFLCRGVKNLAILSAFLDESGDWGICAPRSPYYIATFVFHEQAESITEPIAKLDASLVPFQLGSAVHTGPLIRREKEYLDMSILTRRLIFHRLFVFTRTCKIAYHPIIADKRHATDDRSLADMLTKQLLSFLNENLAYFQSYDKVILYYDYGQPELARILDYTFKKVLGNVEYRRVTPSDYRLFQAADLLCTMELLALKAENKALSRSELSFFRTERELLRTYLKPIRRKRF